MIFELNGEVCVIDGIIHVICVLRMCFWCMSGPWGSWFSVLVCAI